MRYTCTLVLCLIVHLTFSQSFTDTTLYLEINKGANYFGKSVHAYKENGILKEYIETEFGIRECGGELSFLSYKNQTRTITFKQLKKYSVMSFSKLCGFLAKLDKEQDEAEQRNTKKTGIVYQPGPPPASIKYLMGRNIYFIERDFKKKKATITRVYSHETFE